MSRQPNRFTDAERDDPSQGLSPPSAPEPLPDLATQAAGFIATTLGVGGLQLPDALYLVEPGDRTAINVDDIHQGQLGDCFLLSAIGELALYSPVAISRMISVNADGSESVKLFESPAGTPPSFGESDLTLTRQTVVNSFPSASVNGGITQDVAGRQKEIWVQVLEKAYAQANGGYAVIGNGGNPCIALQELTGQPATWQFPSRTTAASLAAATAAGDLIVMDTLSSPNLPYGLVGDHAYMFEGLVTASGVASVKLGNPWGTDQPGLVPVTQLHTAFSEVDLGHL